MSTFSFARCKALVKPLYGHYWRMRANASALLEVQVELGRQVILLKEKHERDNKYGTWGKRLDNFIRGLSAEAMICGEDSNVNLIAKSSVYKYKYIAENWDLVLERGWKHLSFSTVYNRLKAEAKGLTIEGDDISELENEIKGMKTLNSTRGKNASRIQQELISQVNNLQLELDAVKAQLEAREAEIRARDAEIEVARLQLQVAKLDLENVQHQPQHPVSESLVDVALIEEASSQSDELVGHTPRRILRPTNVPPVDVFRRRALEAKRELGRLLVEHQKQWRHKGTSNSAWLRDEVPKLIDQLSEKLGCRGATLSKATIYRYMDIYKYWDTIVERGWLDLSCTEIEKNLTKLRKA